MQQPIDLVPKIASRSRRGFFLSLVGGAGAVVAAPVLDLLDSSPAQVLAQYEAQIQEVAAGADPETLDILERMRQELVRALAKPVEQRRWIMVIDQRKCVGCHACTIACVAENKLPPGVVYRPVLEEEIGVYPNVTRRFTPRPCMQCDNPPCTTVCPVNATFKNADGIVAMNYDQCIGCRACIAACPYGARTFDFGYTYTQNTPTADGLVVGQGTAGTYERTTSFEYGSPRQREGHEASPIGNVRKCHFCMHRVGSGQLPACVTTCIGRATMFGDANDPDSLVAEMIAKPNVMRLKEELGTAPRVYYLT